ncbi:MAG: alpha amylase C-terminal domain-containing protein [Bryobacteraceae bacterium]
MFPPRWAPHSATSAAAFARRQHFTTPITARRCAAKRCRIGVPKPGFYRELFNTDAEMFRGSYMGNGPEWILTENVYFQGQPQSISITAPDRGGRVPLGGSAAGSACVTDHVGR